MAKKSGDPDSGLMAPEPKKPSLGAWLRGRFLAGMVIAAPIAITFFVLQFLINFIDNRVKPLLPPVIQPETYTNIAIPGFGVIVMVVALTVLGAVTTNLLGRSVVRGTDRLLSSVPIVRNVYAAFKQLVEVLTNNQQASYDRVVMVEYPKAGSWCIGFVSSNAKGEIAHRLGREFIGVFVPTTPNPTSGFLIYMKESECIEMDMSIEEGAKMILSAGLVVPEYGTAEPSEQRSLPLADKRTEKLSEEA
ncbi:MAG: hypothetical protein CME85_14445 [Henriciella sp.]|jgi:uncharacterized membrane protein|uniref:DUF502 domain-containing protein n=1 Tax=uncultured Henriciella sp. TaxID=1608424 RepID=UPI000C506B1D|nr:DUF502 domain-containing protein [Henriciella sp.]MAO03007.1 hypothetical protein [Citromicrobium sp.]MBF33529.1 hypothetical protein [Hyphomonadaceae bacterium]MBK76669.1 hypothetical protein [Henriciella sp.]|tara:strand:- start:2513 stop:3256 length:744 start_codon:yes stop_codon:yes gene_type:complete